VSDVEKWKRLLEEDPDNELVLISLAKAHLDAHNFQEAAQNYERVVSIQPEFALGWALLGRCQLQCGDRRAARLSADRALELAVAQKHEVPEMEARAVLDELDAEF
jgi:Flp pilus assembly protein TadD